MVSGTAIMSRHMISCAHIFVVSLLDILKMTEERGISQNRVCARGELPITFSLHRQLPPANKVSFSAH